MGAEGSQIVAVGAEGNNFDNIILQPDLFC